MVGELSPHAVALVEHPFGGRSIVGGPDAGVRLDKSALRPRPRSLVLVKDVARVEDLVVDGLPMRTLYL